MALYVLRHAHTDWNGPPKKFQGRVDVALSSLGLQQAKNYSYQQPYPDFIISSPAKRCLDTIKQVFPEREDIILDENLWEIDMGDLSGKFIHEVGDIYHQWYKKPTEYRLPNAETVENLVHRSRTVVNKYLELAYKKNILFVTHGGPIKAIKSIENSIPIDDLYTIEVKNLDLLEIDLAVFDSKAITGES